MIHGVGRIGTRLILSKATSRSASTAGSPNAATSPRSARRLTRPPAARSCDHPQRRIPGVDFSSVSLVHGLSIGLGMRRRGAWKNCCYDRTLICVMLGRPDLNEARSWKAACFGPPTSPRNLFAIVEPIKGGSTG